MTILRKYSVWALPLVVLLPFASQADSRDDSGDSVTVACGDRYISQRDAARVLHTDNFSQTYAKRQSLYVNIARLCHRGVDQVLLVANERQPKARTLASR